MLGMAMLTTMFDYNAATNARLLACAAHLSDAELDAPADYSRGSLRQTFLHLLVVEWVWRTVCQSHQASDPRALPILQSPTIPALAAFAAEEGRQMRAFLDGASEDDLTTVFPSERGGKTYQIVPWQGLTQILFHSAQHRSEVAEMLTRHGQSPGDIDFIFFANPEMRPGAR